MTMGPRESLERDLKRRRLLVFVLCTRYTRKTKKMLKSADASKSEIGRGMMAGRSRQGSTALGAWILRKDYARHFLGDLITANMRRRSTMLVML